MTYIQQAIKKAIEGGYDRMWQGTHETFDGVLLDPEFWKCLGKSLGWLQVICWFCGKGCKITFDDVSICCREKFSCETIYRWHQFIDHLAKGKDAESFFKEVLAPSNEEGK